PPSPRPHPFTYTTLFRSTAYVDQNQTYTSHSSHQVFVRQYELRDVGGGVMRPFATGNLIEGANGGMANWGEVKAQAAAMLGIELDRKSTRLNSSHVRVSY